MDASLGRTVMITRCWPQRVTVLIATLTLFAFRHSNKAANQECICHRLYRKWFWRILFPERKYVDKFSEVTPTRQRGRVVSMSDSQSGGPEFESRSDNYLDLYLGRPEFKSSATLVNRQLVCLRSVRSLNSV